MKILHVGIYSISNPFHGGQRRARAIFDFIYRNQFNITYASVTLSSEYNDASVNHLNLNLGPVLNDTIVTPYLEDYFWASVANNSEIALKELDQFLSRVSPDLLIFEQPWLFRLFDKTEFVKKRRTPFIYSSQNIEYELKSEILRMKSLNYPHVVEDIKKLEMEILKRSLFSIAVSEYDKTKLLDLGAKEVIIIRNTIDKNFKNVKPVLDIPYACFVGSGHPPNAEGFFKYLGCLLGWVPPKRKIVICGGVVSLIMKDESFNRYLTTNLDRTHMILNPSDSELNSLLYYAHCILLPIFSGGGTNLKTSEALQTGLPIISTPQAMRGYDEFMNVPNLKVAGDKDSFIKATQSALLTKEPLRYSLNESLRELLTWEHQLKPLKNILSKLAKELI